MKVFVAGASGAIGRLLVPRLVAAGHEVTGMTRSEERASALREQGATPVIADAFDESAVKEAMARAEPEVVVHQLTALPKRLNVRRLSEAYTGTDRLRREGTRILMAAAREAGARRVVAQSIAFLYAPEGGPVKDEDARPHTQAPEPFGETVRALMDLERQVTRGDGVEGVVLRYGWFYGPGTYYAPDGQSAEEVRRRRQPVVGKGSGIWSFVHVDDAAGATVLAVEGGPPGIFNVVDDEPAPMREWLPAFAEAIGAKRPWRVPLWVVKLAAPKMIVELATVLRGASNARFKGAFGWQALYPTWRDGFREGLG
jgi:nucleoside-diphosphate-sugar epimerase